jgi:hypothetical protein
MHCSSQANMVGVAVPCHGSSHKAAGCQVRAHRARPFGSVSSLPVLIHHPLCPVREELALVPVPDVAHGTGRA